MPASKDFLFTLAQAAADQTLPRFRQAGGIENKLTSGFDPVTEADKAAEHAIRALIERDFPGHGILGEEHGAMGLDREYVWVIDPIDGTRAFISGLPVWGTLVGLTFKGKAVTGLMAQPFTGEIFYALDGISNLARAEKLERLRTRPTKSLGDATMFTTTPSLFKGENKTRFETLERKVKLSRYGCDCYAYCMVAAGHADLVVEPGLKPYDIVALIPIIENAGGVVTCWDGSPAEKGGDIIAAATPELHRAALEIMNPASVG
jgi:histidinol phosphatase-like enzyme (inositol monophosphatase family)